MAAALPIVIWEYNRSAQKLIEKNEQKRERIKADQIILQAKLRTLDIRIKAVEDLIKKQQNLDDKSLLRAVTVSKKPKYIEPPKETLVTIVDDDEYDDDANSHSTESLEPLSIGKQNKSWWQFW
mmetsp:Transcript_863/g.917  ORF Transcript_863/g.917 Transcript_863/m.917 type:complete len:124 (+) Transcript_863:2-373(+)